MSFEIQTKLNAWATFTLSMAPGGVGLASGAARQSTVVPNTSTSTGRRKASKVFFKYRNGAVAPTAGRIVECFLFEGDDSGNRDDGVGSTDAAVSTTTALLNAYLLGALSVRNAATGTTPDSITQRLWNTSPMGELGTEWGIIIRNGTDQTGDVTEGNFTKRHAPYLSEIFP